MSLYHLKWPSKGIIENTKYVQNQCLQSISRNKSMMSAQNTALIVTPSFNQYYAALEQVLLAYQMVNLQKWKLLFSENYMRERRDVHIRIHQNNFGVWYPKQ